MATAALLIVLLCLLNKSSRRNQREIGVNTSSNDSDAEEGKHGVRSGPVSSALNDNHDCAPNVAKQFDGQRTNASTACYTAPQNSKVKESSQHVPQIEITEEAVQIEAQGACVAKDRAALDHCLSSCSVKSCSDNESSSEPVNESTDTVNAIESEHKKVETVQNGQTETVSGVETETELKEIEAMQNGHTSDYIEGSCATGQEGDSSLLIPIGKKLKVLPKITRGSSSHSHHSSTVYCDEERPVKGAWTEDALISLERNVSSLSNFETGEPSGLPHCHSPHSARVKRRKSSAYKFRQNKTNKTGRSGITQLALPALVRAKSGKRSEEERLLEKKRLRDLELLLSGVGLTSGKSPYLIDQTMKKEQWKLPYIKDTKEDEIS